MNATPSQPLDLRLTENIEALAVAIAMALVLKFFVVEAYQIPTGSMQPTILGYQGSMGSATPGARTSDIHDRILADKLITMLRPPHRWEVMIFRFPLDQRQLYVKRIVGLPGETLEIRGGDVWIDGHIARKPDDVNESVLKAILHPEDGHTDLQRWFSGQGDVEVDRNEARFGERGGELQLRGTVLDDYLDGYDPAWRIPEPALYPMETGHAVADLDLRLTATLTAPANALRLTFAADEGDVVFVLPREGGGEPGRVEQRTPDGTVRRSLPLPEGRALADGRPAEILARTVDHRLLLRVDGEEWLRFDDDDSGPRPDEPRRALLRLGADGPATLGDVRARRDVFYTQKVADSKRVAWLERAQELQQAGQGLDALPPLAHWEIPEGHYFGLGDNTQSSHDGRGWETKTYVLADGREITGFWFDFGKANPHAPSDRNPHYLPGGRLAFADVLGDSFVFGEDEVVDEHVQPSPFIDERFLLGKAVLVFWPILDPFRWKTIR